MQLMKAPPRTSKALSGASSQWPIRQIAACFLAIVSVLLALNSIHVIHPIWTIKSAAAIQLPNRGSSIAEQNIVLALPHKGEPECIVFADGKPLDLSKSLPDTPTTLGHYQVNDGFIFWTQVEPAARKYQIASPVSIRFAGLISLVVAALAVMFLLREIGLLIGLVTSTVRESAAAVQQLQIKLSDIWSPAFGISNLSETSTDKSVTLGWTKAIVLISLITLITVIYCNSGTLAPLNLFSPLVVDSPLPTTVNIDHDYHYALYLLFDGKGQDIAPPYDMYFRRMLFPLLAYPLMKCCGFVYGGMIVSFALNAGAFLAFCAYCYRRWGGTSARIAAVLLCLYPGFAYFCGQPYHFSIIVPASILAAVALSEIERQTSHVRTFCLSLLLGILCLGYDLIALFLPAMVGLLLWQRRFSVLPLAVIGVVAPLSLWCVYLYTTFGPTCLLNANTSTFANALLAWRTMVNPEVFAKTVATMPASMQCLLSTFFFSAFAFLPCLFAITAASSRFMRDIHFSKAEIAFFMWCGFVCLACALAPVCHSSGLAHSGLSEWQPKGAWTIRLYQPVFAMYLLYLSRKWSVIEGARIGWKWVLNASLTICLIGNFLTAFGTILNNPLSLASELYYNFYPGATQSRLQLNLAIYGRKPIGWFDSKTATAIQHRDDLEATNSLSKIREAVPPLRRAPKPSLLRK